MEQKSERQQYMVGDAVQVVGVGEVVSIRKNLLSRKLEYTVKMGNCLQVFDADNIYLAPQPKDFESPSIGSYGQV